MLRSCSASTGCFEFAALPAQRARSTSASPADDGQLHLELFSVKVLGGAQRERQLRFGATRVHCRRAAAKPIAATGAILLHRWAWGTVRCAQSPVGSNPHSSFSAALERFFLRVLPRPVLYVPLLVRTTRLSLPVAHSFWPVLKSREPSVFAILSIQGHQADKPALAHSSTRQLSS